MAKSDGKILLALAASDFSPAALRTFAETIQRFGADVLVQKILALRHQAETELTSLPYQPEDKDDRPGLMLKEKLADDVERLLLVEARLSKNAAAVEILRNVRNHLGKEGAKVPSFNKENFRRWIERVTEEVPPSVLLHIATSIRNERVHGSRSAWPLKQPNE